MGGISRGLFLLGGICFTALRILSRVVLGFCGCNGGDSGNGWLSSELTYPASVPLEANEAVGLGGGLWGCVSVVLMVLVSKDISVCDLW